MAVRTPGRHDGPRRTPDRWRAAPTGENTPEDAAKNGQEPVNAEPTGCTANAPESSADNTDSENTPADEATPNTSAATVDDRTETTGAPVADASPDAPAPDAKQSDDGGSGDEDPHHTQNNDVADAEDAPAPQADPARRTATPVEARALPGRKKRLAPGALRCTRGSHTTQTARWTPCTKYEKL
ncbi:hypothetical protein ACH4UM_25670 [Streptomyces sp. NPDC020801]|uniref:hypothetical protein n=1 Tax=unclassified Streptomyces TaxID=2593676 RepID=UPI0037976D1D